MNATAALLRSSRHLARSGDAGKSCAAILSWLFLGLVLVMIDCGVNAAFAAGAKAQLDVRAIVLTVMKVRMVSQPSQLTISENDVANGYVDLVDASALLITSNSGAGFMLSMTYAAELVSRVSARLTGQFAATLEGEGTVAVRAHQVRDEPMRVSYRLFLNQAARAGSYPWPVALSFTPDAV
jgi:hypothetical protein